MIGQRNLLRSVGCGLLGWVVLALTLPHLVPGSSGLLFDLAAALAAVALLAAGVIQLIRARTAADPLLEWNGVALVTFGMAIAVLGGMQVFSRVGNSPQELSLARTLVLWPTLLIFALSVRTGLPRIGRSVGRVLAAGLVGYTAIGLVLGTPAVRTVLARGDRSTAWLAVGALATAGWTVLAARFAGLAGTLDRRRWAGAMALLAAGSLTHTVGLRIVGRGAEDVSAALLLAAATVILGVVIAGLRDAQAASSNRLLAIDAALGRARQRIRESEERAAEQRHDALTAALGIEAALRERADPALARLVRAELTRLVGLVAPAPVQPPQTFTLRDVLEPVVTAQRLSGLAVHAELSGPAVVGQPGAVAGALANALANSATHAPGATVTVRSVVEAGHVTVVVDDDGPGIPEADRDRVLLRAERGAEVAVAGSGLGLYTAERAMREHGGALRVTERPGGGTRVMITVPTARVDAAGAA
ncbi:MAG: hypothetical protein EPN43_01830 [Jatrophihabitans sp.]|nr:MAG: hypothetical protein EPN43_01830 [Jatrophihabitans sp.]